MPEGDLGQVPYSGKVEVDGHMISVTHRAFSYYVERSPAILDYLNQDSLILDLGAGNAHFGPVVNRTNTYPAQVVRFDYSYSTQPPWEAEMAVSGHSAHLPFNDESFDLITASHVLRHFSTEEVMPMIGEAMRVLKPSGQMHARPIRTTLSAEEMSAEQPAVTKNIWGTMIVTKPAEFSEWTSETVDTFTRFIAHICGRWA